MSSRSIPDLDGFNGSISLLQIVCSFGVGIQRGHGIDHFAARSLVFQTGLDIGQRGELHGHGLGAVGQYFNVMRIAQTIRGDGGNDVRAPMRWKQQPRELKARVFRGIRS